MASDTTPEIIQQETNVVASLPFSDLDKLKFGHVISGPRISLRRYRAYYGCISIRNYLAGHTKKSLRLRAKRVTDLKAFVNLPVELQILVLEHLHPIDLYHFSQVSRNFRQLVLDPAAMSVWKAAFMRHPYLPTPPPGVKEPEWAFMIYGPGICGVCGKYGALTDFSFQKRFCGPCMGAHTLPQSDFRDELNNAIPSHHVIWELIPCTKRRNSLRHSMGTARYSKTDFSIMWKKLKLILILKKNGLPLLSPLYTDYITARKKYIQRLNYSAEESNKWAICILRQFLTEYEGLAGHVTAKCQARLQALGYDERDTGSAFKFIQILLKEKAIYRLTRKAFREIKPRIEVILKYCRIDRMKNERRRGLLQIYQDYLKTRSPDEWPYLPDGHAPSFWDTELFEKLLGPPIDAITPDNVLPFLPEFVEKWIKAQREEFAVILLKNPNETSEARVQRLELATSVITCGTCVVIGWKSIYLHQVNCWRSTRYVGHHAVVAATSLVSCIGLDPLTTTVDDMNCRNDRFMCGNCSPEVYRGRLSRRVFTWLECLRHTIDQILSNRNISASHSEPNWLPLSPSVARFARGNEKPYPDPSISIWRCNLCAHNFRKRVQQADAIDHVKKVHCVKIPAIGVDVVVDPRHRIPQRRVVFRLSLDPALCKHCSDMPIFKLWEKSVLMNHLIKRHHIPEPAEHVDWETVPIFELPSTPVPT